MPRFVKVDYIQELACWGQALVDGTSCTSRGQPACMMGALARWRKPDKQTAYDAALARAAKLGVKQWVVPRERMELATK